MQTFYWNELVKIQSAMQIICMPESEPVLRKKIPPFNTIGVMYKNVVCVCH